MEKYLKAFSLKRRDNLRVMDYKDELKLAFLSYMSGQIEYDELDKRIEELFYKAVYEELREKGVEVK